MRCGVVQLLAASAFTEVDGDAPELAIENAEFHASLCHQCAREVELGDPIGYVVTLDGEEVLRQDDTEDLERERCVKLVEEMAAKHRGAAQVALRKAANAIRRMS